MAPQRWTTPEQFEFLSSKFPVYMGNVANHTQPLFFPGLFEEWFSKWPEVDALIAAGKFPAEASELHDASFTMDSEQKKTLKTAIKERKKVSAFEYETSSHKMNRHSQRIQSWMRNFKKKKTNDAPAASLLTMLQTGKRRRCRQEEELYESVYKEKVNTLIKEELERNPEPPAKDDGDGSSSSDSDQGSDVSDSSDDESGKAQKNLRHRAGKGKKKLSWKMRVRRRVRKQAWKDESEDVKREIKDMVEKEPERIAASAKEEKRGLERPGEQRQKMIASLPNILSQTCKDIHRLSGWSTLIITGGPMPVENGKLAIQSVTFGETEAGNNFLTSYPDYDEAVAQPFLQWLKKVYPKHLRRGLAVEPDSSDVQGNALQSLISMDDVHAEPETQTESSPIRSDYQDITTPHSSFQDSSMFSDEDDHRSDPSNGRSPSPVSSPYIPIDPVLLNDIPRNHIRLDDGPTFFNYQEHPPPTLTPLAHLPPPTSTPLAHLSPPTSTPLVHFPPPASTPPAHLPLPTSTPPAHLPLPTSTPPAHLPLPTSTPPDLPPPTSTPLDLCLPMSTPPAHLPPPTSTPPEHLPPPTSTPPAHLPPSPPVHLPETRPATKPKATSSDTTGANRKKRERKKKQPPPQPAGPDQIQPINAATRRHVREVNAAAAKKAATKRTPSLVNLDGLNPLFILPASSRREHRRPHNPDGTIMASPPKPGKRRANGESSEAPPPKRSRKK
ncbi:hypothetical protein Hypma_012247 [Hypsizygus marmoreus]|uniref:Uncharacterized protein n=1 Tax=Hypsizygus marmoreus TaxID=39966 RepID=A0A369JJA2_HYPMA|nr:hypothetical protein Hypma_012247 [Hypsizygus marmoreus]